MSETNPNRTQTELNYGYGYNDSNSIVIIWCIDDVRHANEITYDPIIELSDSDCMDVLIHIRENHDASMGISWDQICWALEDLYGHRYKEEASNE